MGKAFGAQAPAPNDDVLTTKSAVIPARTSSSSVDRSDATNIVKSETTATPTSSAGRGGGAAPRAAARVLLREQARDAEHPPQHTPGATHRGCHEHGGDHAARPPTSPSEPSPAARKEPLERAADAATPPSARTAIPATTRARPMPVRSAPALRGAERRDGRRPPGGELRGHDGRDHAGDETDGERGRLDGHTAGRQGEAEAVEQALQEPGHAEPGDHAHRRHDEPDDRRLDRDRGRAAWSTGAAPTARSRASRACAGPR